MDSKLLLKSLSPKMMSKAIAAFDRATVVVVSACWGAALAMMGIAVYTLVLSISARHATDTVMATEPTLPKVVHKPMDLKQIQAVFDRMGRRFPDITFSVHGQGLGVTSANGAKFHQWLTALSYVDTISPEYHWSIEEFCVGECVNAELMHAVLKGDRINFEAPAADKN
ncbi:MAG: hypothetical protein M3N08_00785 [Pseudomonadota bacterium]|nr:hypothetical protein [Pseudomonadota bacterium]